MANKKNAVDNLPNIYKTSDNPNCFKKNDERTKEIARKGGRAAQEKLRKKKEMRESLEILLSMNLKKGTAKDTEKIKNLEEMKGQNVTAQDAILYSLILTAMGGGRDGVAAYKAITDTLQTGNDIVTLNTECIDNLSKEEIMKLADMDEDLNEEEGEYGYDEEE